MAPIPEDGTPVISALIGVPSSDAGRINSAAATAASMASAPEPIQRLRQLAPAAIIAETAIADIMTPKPTPANWMADNDPYPEADNRSRTRVDGHTMTKALATPPAKRRPTKDTMSDGSPIAAVDTALIISATRSKGLGQATVNGLPASNAP